jgi:hypothetical protein
MREMKSRLHRAALAEVRSGMKLGLGTGSAAYDSSGSSASAGVRRSARPMRALRIRPRTGRGR